MAYFTFREESTEMTCQQVLIDCISMLAKRYLKSEKKTMFI